MIAAVVALAAVLILLAAALIVLVREHDIERREWRDERRGLIDRVIAHHAGEVIALDRSSAPPKPPRPEAVRPIAEGL